MESSVVGYLAYNGLLPISTSSQVEILNQDFRAECLPKWLSGQEWKGVMGSSSHLGSPWMRQAPHRLGFDHWRNPGKWKLYRVERSVIRLVGFSTMGPCNTAMGICSPLCGEDERWGLEFGISGKGGITNCSKRREGPDIRASALRLFHALSSLV